MRKLFTALAVLSVLAGPALADTASIPPAVTERLGADLAATAHEIAPAPSGAESAVQIVARAFDQKGRPVMMDGSGVYIGNGIVITDKHVVAESKNPSDVEVILGRNDYPAEHIKVVDWRLSKTHDVAFLKLAHVPGDLQAAKMACRAPKVGEPIEKVGSPIGQFFIHTWGHVAGVQRTDGPFVDVVPVDLPTGSGDSGGPVYDAKGEVLGIVEGVVHGDGIHNVGSVQYMNSGTAICQMLAGL